MMAGKVGQALKFINNDDNTIGIHTLTEDIKQILEDKHPKGEEICADVLLPDTSRDQQPVIFESLSTDMIKEASKNLNGSGGPTLIDSDIWKHILCSNFYGKVPDQLAESMALLGRRLCSEDIEPNCLNEYLSCRLIPLDKGMDKNNNPGVRPIRIGEVFRRIIGKAVVKLLKTDIEEAAGPMQTCAGLRSGIEAAIHSSKYVWEQDTTEALIQVDADNAFNRLNRKVAIHNIKQICPPIHKYLQNHYRIPSKLIINDACGQDNILSEEGCTQGDVAAMAFYALGIKPLIDNLADSVNPDVCKQAWYADDSSAAGRLVEIRKWWDILCAAGPKYGYIIRGW